MNTSTASLRVYARQNFNSSIDYAILYSKIRDACARMGRERKPLVVILIAVLLIPSFIVSASSTIQGTVRFSSVGSIVPSHSVELSINTSSGIPVSDLFFGDNLQIWSVPMFSPAPADTSLVTLVKFIRPGLIRFPGGNNEAYWDRSNTYKWWEAPPGYRYTITAQVVDDFITFCREVGAEPFIQVDMNTYAPDLWADLVKYCNIDHNYNVKYWGIGDEPNHWTTLEGYMTSSRDYVAAMAAVDPSIRLSAPEMGGIWPGDINSWIEPFVKQRGSDVHLMSAHHYPLGDESIDPSKDNYPSIENLLRYDATDPVVAGISYLNIVSTQLLDLRDKYVPQGIVALTEYGPSWAPLSTDNRVSDSLSTALWLADTLGRLGMSGIHSVLYYSFTSPDWDDFRNALFIHSRYPEEMRVVSLRPTYYAYLMYGKWRGEYWVSTSTTNDEYLSICASVSHESNDLYVIVFNKHTSKNITATLSVYDGNVSSRGYLYILNGDTYDATLVNINGATIDVTNSSTIENSVNDISPIGIPISPQFSRIFPAHSASVIHIPLKGS